MDSETQVRKTITQAEIMRNYGMSRNGIINAMKSEGMPMPIKLSPGRKGWLVNELAEWFANRPRGIHPTLKR